jgi:hypothetical protein
MVYGPNYCLRPCCPPFNGLLPAPALVAPGFPQANPGYGMPPHAPGQGGHPGQPPYGFGANPAGYPPGQGPINSPLFPTHPYARSPRDFFMIDLCAP